MLTSDGSGRRTPKCGYRVANRTIFADAPIGLGLEFRILSRVLINTLCIAGKWGVGKTYTWQTELDRARAARSVGLKRYFYVSLFGINSLEGLKLSIFENLEFLDTPPASRLEQAVHTAKSVAAQAKKWSDLASALPALAKAGPLYFSAVRNQIICIDDLERRGSGLSVKDVFGLISFLREQRGCKIVLLLSSPGRRASRI
jgi:hypothetical protein